MLCVGEGKGVIGVQEFGRGGGEVCSQRLGFVSIRAVGGRELNGPMGTGRDFSFTFLSCLLTRV